MAFTLPSQRWMQNLDQLMLQGASYLFASPKSSADIAIVHVPQEEMTTWQTDIHSSGKLAALLANILNSSDSSIGLLLNQPLDVGSGAADLLIENYVKVGADKKNDKVAEALVDRKYILFNLLKNPRVVVGVDNFTFSGQKPLLLEASFFAQIPEFLKKIVWPPCGSCFRREEGIAIARPKVDQFSITLGEEAFSQIVHLSENGEVYSGFSTELLRSAHKISRDTNIKWEFESGLALGDTFIPLATSGELIALNNLSSRMRPLISSMPLEEALARSAFQSLILIARDGDPQAEKIAASLYSIQNNAVLVSPWWVPLLRMGILIVISLYLVLALSRVNMQLGVMISFVIGFGLLGLQMALVMTKQYWLPLGLHFVWLAMGHFLLLVWMLKKKRIQRLIDRADDICIDHAKQLLDKQEINNAYTQLKDCSVREPLLQTLYDISEAYTDQNDYQNAVEVLNSIKLKKKSYKDTEQKLQVLMTMMKSAEKEAHEDDMPLQKTMVIDAVGMENRVLGRYEIEKEIGRGAMGQVYLGFDPKIARRVAIKTMKYDAFKAKEKEEIKSRFFREAEAAGRLNHPSIVQVYDVGEEGDLAFIAMDYAEGKALNHFVTQDNLLPVFEVYRIICDVAQALEYAHENNIVHRDVKPGNIIYNPSPYQVKVTDFGIARITDDSKTNTGEILGSPLYMAPEQLKGKKVNRSADIFSLGVTFYQLLTGHLPYSGDNLAALTYEIIHGKHKSVRSVRKDLPASAARITNQALQKDTEDRYETAAEMALVIKKAIKRDFSAEAKKSGYI
ncbi:MAG: serine/threonine protein kinase [Agarilytica sp.]